MPFLTLRTTPSNRLGVVLRSSRGLPFTEVISCHSKCDGSVCSADNSEAVNNQHMIKKARDVFETQHEYGHGDIHVARPLLTM